MSAIELLEKAAGHLKDRAATYDSQDGERSIGATVQAFNAITGDGMMNSEERGWLFMAILKMVRSQQGNYKADNYEDLAAYSALMGEAACEERNGSWTDYAIKQAAFKDAYKEYTLQEVIGDAVLSDWARWVAVDKDGGVREYEDYPYRVPDGWIISGGKYSVLGRVVPPLNYTKCIWEVNFNPDCEYTLDSVIGDAELSDWARWVAVDADGEVWEYEEKPFISNVNLEAKWCIPKGRCNLINKVVRPLNFKNCIWVIKK